MLNKIIKNLCTSVIFTFSIFSATVASATTVSTPSAITVTTPSAITVTTPSAINFLQIGADKTIATWLWNTNLIETNLQQIIDFLVAKNVNTVYLQIDTSIAKSSYANFIQAASNKSIQVHALGGSSTWVTDTGFKKAITFMNWVKAYQDVSTTEQKFKGVHLDIEPYLCAKWNTNKNSIINLYQNLLIQMKAKSTAMNLPFSVDIAFWFDGVNFSTTQGKGILAQWVISNTDSVTIMAYRDTSTLINSFAKDEIIMANALGKKVIIGVETGQSSEGANVTFFEEGESAMATELQLVVDTNLAYNSFGGVSIHHFGSWSTMKQ